MNRPFAPTSRHAAWLAALLCVSAVLVAAALLDGYRHDQHPIGLLGASGLPHAVWFNVFGFVAPGVLLTGAAVALRGRLPEHSGRTAGVGAWLLALSAVAFAAQGLLPLDPRELDAPQSQWHATAWTLWWIAFVPGALLLAASLGRMPGCRRLAVGLAACAVAVLLLAALPPLLVPGPVGQRVALGAWLLAYVAVAYGRGGPA